jgi:hypothetical protein
VQYCEDNPAGSVPIPGDIVPGNTPGTIAPGKTVIDCPVVK